MAHCRFDGAFGLTAVEIQDVPGLERWQLSVQTAYLSGRDLFGLLDFKLGRQLVMDAIDFMMLDGLVATVRSPWYLGIEVMAGVESHEALGPATSSQFQLDGIRYLPADTDEVLPVVVVGAALVTTGLRDTRARIGYRRLFSEDGVRQEKIGVSLYQRVMERLHINGAFSFDLVNLRPDSVNVLLRGQITDAWTADLQYVHLVPNFDLDSIFNIFSTDPLNDVNARVRWHVNSTAYLHMGGMLRFFGSESLEAEEDAGDTDALVESFGVMAGYFHAWRRQGRVRADLSYEDGYGGRRFLVDLAGMWGVMPGEWELEGRVTAVLFEDETQVNLRGASFGYQLGGRYLVDSRAAISLMVEHNFNRFHKSQLRVFVSANLDFFMGDHTP